MSLEFRLRRAYQRGYPTPAALAFVEAKGSFVVSEARDEAARRLVLTAQFTRTDAGEPIAPLRDAKLLGWNGTVMSITGVEEVIDDNLGRSQRFAQTWLLEPEMYAELLRLELLFGRAVGRLRELGVVVNMQPNGGMWISGEHRPD